MNIQFNTARYDTDLVVEKAGETVILNGEVFDFTALPVGATLPVSAINSIWFGGDVHRDDAGVLHLTLIRPYGYHATEERRTPVLMTDLPDGVIPFPPYGTNPELEAAAAEEPSA